MEGEQAYDMRAVHRPTERRAHIVGDGWRLADPMSIAIGRGLFPLC